MAASQGPWHNLKVQNDGEVVELLQELIRNKCVNDGTPGSGHERRNAELLASVFDGTGLDVSVMAPPDATHRASVIARLEGRSSAGRNVTLLPHTDVVPVTTSDWDRDPFAGDLVDGEVWGRGAVDMLNQTAAMAIGLKRLARSGYAPRGTIIFAGVADEEWGGKKGTEWLIREHYAAIRADVVFTEIGGIQKNHRISVGTEEKGLASITLKVHGQAGHGSTPWYSDNAILNAASVLLQVEKYQSAVRLPTNWREWIEAQELPNSIEERLIAGQDVASVLPELPVGLAGAIHAASHTTVSPNVIRGGTLSNIIPNEVTIELDVRLARGHDAHAVCKDIEALCKEAGCRVDVILNHSWAATESSRSNAIWEVMERASSGIAGPCKLIPTPITAATDARFFRHLDVPAYGFGLLSPQLSSEDYWARFHGVNERIDVESLSLSAALWNNLLKELSA